MSGTKGVSSDSAHVTQFQSQPTPSAEQTRQVAERLPSSQPEQAHVTAQSQDVQNLLNRAGLREGHEVRDTGAVDSATEALHANRASKTLGTDKTSQSVNTKPVTPPRIELNEDLRVGAESFANNIDVAINSLLIKGGSGSPSRLGDESLNSMFAKLERIGANASALDSKGGAALKEGEIIATLFSGLGGGSGVGARGATSATGSRAGADGVSGRGASLRSLDEMSADELLATFLKLNITDPNNSVETHNDMYEAMTNLRQQAIDEAQQKAKVAAEKMKEAESEAAYASQLGSIVTIIMIIIAIVVICASCGTMTAPMLLLLKVVAAVVSAVLQIVKAAAQEKAAQKAADAAEAKNDVERMRAYADQMQAQLEEENAIIKLIMESKNKMVDAVMQMMNASFATQNKVMSAAMTR